MFLRPATRADGVRQTKASCRLRDPGRRAIGAIGCPAAHTMTDGFQFGLVLWLVDVISPSTRSGNRPGRQQSSIRRLPMGTTPGTTILGASPFMLDDTCYQSDINFCESWTFLLRRELFHLCPNSVICIPFGCCLRGRPKFGTGFAPSFTRADVDQSSEE